MKKAIFQKLHALGDPLRVRMLRVLAEGEFSVGELTSILQVPQSTASRHLKLLLGEGWIRRRAEGPASWLSFPMAQLDRSSQELWRLVSGECGGADTDLRRMRSVLALRQVDSQSFFRQVGAGWQELRRDLFGETFLLPTLLSLLPDGHVVADLGCGTGDSLLLLGECAQKVIGVDRSPEMLDIARSRLGNLKNVELREGTMESLPLADGEVDALLCMLALHHVGRIDRALVEMARVLKPGGRMVLLDMVEHGRDEFRRNMGHQHLGFSKETVGRASEGLLGLQRWRELPGEAGCLGPPLFIAILSKSV
jgi:SAM-dependent methyltransferase